MRFLQPLFALLLLAFTLTGCIDLAPKPPGDASLNLGTVYLRGVLEEQVQVSATGSWRIQTGASWLRANPSSGVGDATIQITVDPSELQPGEHTSQITLSADGGTSQYKSVVFAFPRLRGSVVLGPEPAETLTLLSSQSLPSRPGRLLVGLTDAGGSDLAPMSTDGFRTLAASVVTRQRGMRLQSTFERSGVAVVEANNMRSAAASLASNPNVRYVEQDVPLQLLSNDPYRLEQWALDIMHVEEAWDLGDGAGVRVAVIDAGFDANHPDFGDNIVETFDFASDSTSLTARPNCGTHGEHVAGIIAAEADNSLGVAGIAPASVLALLNVGDGDPNSDVCPLYTSYLVAALDWVVGEEGSGPRADIVNMSLGGPHTEALLSAVREVYYAGVTLVAATGNSALGSVLYPAAYPEVIAVSATGKWDEVAAYSTVGPEVFVSAPGGNDSDSILSTVHSYVGEMVEHDYGYMQGTSMASPAVAAVAALALSVNPGLTPVGLAGVLADASEDLGDTGRDDDFGYGRVDALEAVVRADTATADPAGYILRINGQAYPLAPVEQFVAGYVGGSIDLEAGSDDDWDGVLEEPGEYYGTLTTDVTFGSEFFDVVIPVAKR